MDALLKIRSLDIIYRTEQGEVRANRDICLDLYRGQTLGLIGETGCGKSTLARAVLRLLPPNTRISGEICFDNQQLLELDSESMRCLRGRQIALIPQSSGSCLNPSRRIGSQMAESICLHQRTPWSQAWRQAAGHLRRLQIKQADRWLGSYPHQLSGGMQQRVMTALGMSGHPSLLIADEPTHGLDAVARYHVVENLRQLQLESGAAALVITHDLRLARHLCDHIAVMYAGEIVERGRCQQVLEDPRHPYTKSLLAALPGPGFGTVPVPAASLPVVQLRGATAAGFARAAW